MKKKQLEKYEFDIMNNPFLMSTQEKKRLLLFYLSRIRFTDKKFDSI